jgi:periplasmic protein TonB
MRAPPSPFARTLRNCAVAHGSVVMALAITALLQGCLRSRRPRELVTYLEMGAPAPAAELIAPPEPPKPDPPPPEPPKPPEDIPENIRPRPPKVQVQTNRVVRRETPAPPAPPRPPTAAEIRRALGGGPTLSGGSPGGTVVVPAWYLSQVRARMYEAWLQPGGLSASGLTAEAEIRVERDGRVTRRRLTQPSGNAVMDASVQRALDEVDRLPALPAEFREKYVDIPIVFQLRTSVM